MRTERQGKAAALNAGLDESDADIIVFSDTSIMLDSEALRNIVAPFKSPEIGCRLIKKRWNHESDILFFFND